MKFLEFSCFKIIITDGELLSTTYSTYFNLLIFAMIMINLTEYHFIAIENYYGIKWAIAMPKMSN
jgi:hypothetical protein